MPKMKLKSLRKEFRRAVDDLFESLDCFHKKPGRIGKKIGKNAGKNARPAYSWAERVMGALSVILGATIV